MDYMLQLVVRCQHSENRRPIHSGTIRYNPLLRDRTVVIGCRTFHNLLMPSNHQGFREITKDAPFFTALGAGYFLWVRT